MASSERTESQVGIGQPSSPTDPSSWVDHIIRGVNRLPFPPLVFYIGLFALVVFLVYLSYWVDGSLPFGNLNIPFPIPLLPFYSVMSLAAVHYTDTVALRSFEKFLPALGKDEVETAHLRHILTTTPQRPALLMAAIGAVFIIPTIYFSAEVRAMSSLKFSFILAVIIAILGFSLTAVLLYHTVRQLRLVSYIHSTATKINLMQLAPVYAFSSLSAQTGLIFLLVLWFDLLFIPETYTNPALIALNVIGLGLLAIACFILPLLGMHQRLVIEKQHRLAEVNRRIQESTRLLYERMDGNDLHDADALNKAIGSLITTHDFLMKIPTWPWRPETFTLFFSALTLPIVVYIIQSLLKNLFVVK